MIQSMTGYGRGEGTLGTRRLTAEVRAVNNRYLDCTVKMPRAYIFAEDAIKARVQKAVSRGKVDVFFTIEQGSDDGVEVRLNRPLAMGYMKAMEDLQATCGLTFDRSAATIARLPDVLTVEKKQEDLEAISAELISVLDRALSDFNAMRLREGAALAEDVLARAETIEEYAALVAARMPQVAAEYRAKLEARMREVLENAQIEESRLLTEAAIFADKVAVDEELVRLRSHLDQLRQMLRAGGGVGRKLDFLLQEFNREVNTIGSKCNDLEVARHVVEIKAELEKIREQIQNIE